MAWVGCPASIREQLPKDTVQNWVCWNSQHLMDYAILDTPGNKTGNNCHKTKQIKQKSRQSQFIPSPQKIIPDPALLQGHPGDVCPRRSAPALHGEALPDLEVLTPLVLQGQSVERGHVHPAALADAELQLLEQRDQEEEHLAPGNVLPDAPPPPQAEHQHLLPLLFVHSGPVSAEETLGVEGFWVLPKIPGRENIKC